MKLFRRIKTTYFYDAMDFAFNNINTGFSLNDLVNYLKLKKHNVSKNDDFLVRLYTQIIEIHNDPIKMPEFKHKMNIETFIEYLNVKQIQKAERDSRIAIWIAIGSLIISSILSFISIIKT